MFHTKLQDAATKKFWNTMLKNWNDDILTFAGIMPSKFRIQETRLITQGTARNFYFSLNMRDWFIMLLCYFPATLPEPSFVMSQLKSLGLPTDMGDTYKILYDAITFFGNGLQLIIGLTPTRVEILQAQDLFDKAILELQSISKSMSFNWHTLLHFCERMLSRGNMRNFWLFFFERLNKMAKATLTNGRNGSLQVLKNFCKKHLVRQRSITSTASDIVSDCHLLSPSQTNPVTGKPMTRSQSKKNVKLAQVLVGRIEKRACKRQCPNTEEALRQAYAASDHPKLLSGDKSIDDGTDSSLKTWPAKMSICVEFGKCCLDGGALHRGLFEYLQTLHPNHHIQIVSLTKYKTCEVNGTTVDISSSSSRSHTSHVYALRPGVDDGPPPALHVGIIRNILSVNVIFTSNDSIATIIGQPSPCTCVSPWRANEESHKCPIENDALDKLNGLVSMSGEMNIVVVDWLVPYHKQNIPLEKYQRELQHSSGKFMTSDTLHHEFNVHGEITLKLLEDNRRGKHFLDVRRIIHGVVLKKVERVQLTILKFNPAYYLVLQLPKFI